MASPDQQPAILAFPEEPNLSRETNYSYLVTETLLLDRRPASQKEWLTFRENYDPEQTIDDSLVITQLADRSTFESPESRFGVIQDAIAISMIWPTSEIQATHMLQGAQKRLSQKDIPFDGYTILEGLNRALFHAARNPESTRSKEFFKVLRVEVLKI